MSGALPTTMSSPNGTTRTAELMERLLLTKEHVAELLGVPVATVEYLHRMDSLPAVKVGKRLAWKPEAVQLYVRKLEPEKG